MPDINDRNRQTIEALRANEGKVGGFWEGRPLLLLTTTGAKSGQERTTPTMYLRDGDRLLIFASTGSRIGTYKRLTFRAAVYSCST